MKEEFRVPHMERNNSRQQHTLGARGWKGEFAKEDLGFLVDNKLALSQHCTPVEIKRPTVSWAALGGMVPAGK